MKYLLEFDTKDLPDILGAFLPIVNRIMKTVERGQDISLKRTRISLQAQGIREYQEGSSEDSSEESSSEEDHVHTVHTPQLVKPVPKPALTPEEQVGRVCLMELVEKWEVNFNVEGEQPDRLVLLGDVARRRAQIMPLLEYVKAAGGLTRGIHSVRSEVNSSADPLISRLIGANMTQIASHACPPLADQFQYPNPLETVNP
jgi:hypothetical protein